MSGKDFPKRGEIYWVDLDPTRGAETHKKRPGLVISNDMGNELSRIVMVAPITSKVKKIYPFEVSISLKGKKGRILLNQCRAVDKSRLLEQMDKIDQVTLQAVEEALKIVFALD